MSLGREVAVLCNGRLVQTAAPLTVYRQPATREVASLVGEAVLLPGRVDKDTVCCGLGRLPLMSPVPGERVDVLVRPEQIRLLPPSTETAAEQQMPRAIVEAVTFFGHDASVRLRLERDPHDSALSPSHGPALIHSRVASHLAPNTGAIVMLAVEGPVHAYPSA
jgi:iron(III) transport system ATP-binding protein